MSSLRAALTIVCMLGSASMGVAEEVSIKAGGQTGRGFTLTSGNECFVVTPKHVVSREDGSLARVIEVQGSLNTQSEAVVVRRHPDADLALLSLNTPDAVRCGEQDYAALPLGLQAVTRLESGIVKFLDVALEGENPPEIFVRSDLEITKGFSGSSLYLNGERIGVMYGLDQRNGMIRAYTLDYIYAALNIGQLRPMDVETAQAVLDRAIENRDGSAQGQNVAISALNTQGYIFSGVDLSGVNLDGAVLADGDISSARLHFSTMINANASKLNLAGSGLRFANVSGANLSQSDMSGVFGPLLEAVDLSAPNAKMTGANFMFGNFRGANLQGADLSDATFAFADLTGADLRGANLTNTYFVGAVLVDAQLDDAILENTSLLGAVLAQTALDADQTSNACRHKGDTRGFSVRLLERWPSDRYDSGYQFEDILEYTRLPWVTGLDDTSLPICASTQDLAVGWSAYSPTSIGMHLDREYLSRAGRSDQAKARVIKAIERAQAARVDRGIFQGSKAYVDAWVAHLEAAAASGEMTGRPFADSDILNLHLIKSGVVTLNDDLWQQMLRERHRFERAIGNSSAGDFQSNTAWGQFFPENAPFEEVQEFSIDAFKDWTQRRMENLGDTLVVRAPGCVRSSTDSALPAFSLATGYLATMPDGSFFPQQISWRKSSWARAIEAQLDGMGRFVGAPFRSLASQSAHPVGFVFPEEYRTYVLDITTDAATTISECSTNTELELGLVKIEQVENAGTSVLVYVEPRNLRIFDGGTVIAEGIVRAEN